MTEGDRLDRVIAAGACGFIVILALSAYWDRTIIWLHFLQALGYVAVIVLVMRHNKWGYFLGFSFAAFWNYVNLFVTSFFRAGLEQAWYIFHTGTLPRPDLFISVPAVFVHFVMIFGGIVAYLRLREKSVGDAVRFIIAFAGSIAYFAADMALTQPRYLPIFARLFHPQLHI